MLTVKYISSMQISTDTPYQEGEQFPTNGTPTYRQTAKCSKPPPNVPLTLDPPPILKINTC